MIYIGSPSALTVLAVGVALATLVAWLLVSDSVSLGQRTLWIAFVLVIAMATLVWDAIEVRFEFGGRAIYWRSDWDWESGGGGVTEWVAMTALFIGPLLAAALAYSSVLRAGSRLLGPGRRRVVLSVVAVPIALILALGLAIAIDVHPLLFYPERTS
jgi:hypothetical protein